MKRGSTFFWGGLVLFLVGTAVIRVEFAPTQLVKYDIESFIRGLGGVGMLSAGWVIVRSTLERDADVPNQNE